MSVDATRVRAAIPVDSLILYRGTPFGCSSITVTVVRFNRSPGIDPSPATGSALIGMHLYSPHRVDGRVSPPERTKS